MTVGCEGRLQPIACEIEICKRLVSNNAKIRKQGISTLKGFLKSDRLKEVDTAHRIWNGLFNYVWMSDTPSIQEADVENISNLIHCTRSFEAAMLFTRGFFTSLSIQWARISHYRIDKFLMFVRRFLRQIFFLLKNSDWNAGKLCAFSSELYSAVQMSPVGLIQHLSELYTEELAKVSEGSIPTDALILLLKCFVQSILHMQPSKSVVNHINTNIFCALVRQLKLLIKQKAAVEFDPEAFALEEPSNGSDSKNPSAENAQNFDPRPGNVHVFVPYIDFDENKIVEFLENSIESDDINQKGRNIILQIIQMFKSVTRLRQSIMNQPAKISHEVEDNERKRKRKREKFSSLVKKACKKLEDEEDDFPTKKMRKLFRANTWEITENVDTKSKTEIVQGWTVSDLPTKTTVSFCKETDSVTYEAEFNQSTEVSSVAITVPHSACENRHNILIPEENYAIVDFRNTEIDRNSIEDTETTSMDNVAEDTNIEPFWIRTQFGKSDSTVEKLKPSDEIGSVTVSLPKYEPAAESDTERDMPLKKRGRRASKPCNVKEEEDSNVDLTIPPKKRGRRSVRKDDTNADSIKNVRRSTRRASSDLESSDISPLKTRSGRSLQSTLSTTRRESKLYGVKEEDSELEVSSPPKKPGRKSVRKVEAKFNSNCDRRSTRGQSSDVESVTSDISPLKTRSGKSLQSTPRRSTTERRESKLHLVKEKVDSDVDATVTPKKRGRKSMKETISNAKPVASPTRTRSGRK